MNSTQLRQYTSDCLATKYLPLYHFLERHEVIGIAATPEAILDAVKNFNDQQDQVLDILLRAREFPSRLATYLGMHNQLSKRKRFGLNDFLLLEETSTEIAFGLVGRFWRLDFGLTAIKDAAEFRNFDARGVAKLVMSFTVQQSLPGVQKLLTETRVSCPDLRSRLFFTPYWIVIRIASGWIRRRILVQIKQQAEASCGRTVP